jgi:xylulokinase
MEIKANVLGINLDIPYIEESAVMGAAVLAGLGAGVYKNINEAISMLDVPRRHVEFNKFISSKYDALYSRGYKELYNMLKPINEILNEF